MSSGSARARAQMEPSKSAAINSAKTELYRKLGPGRRPTGRVDYHVWSQTVSGIKYWYCDAQCDWSNS